MKPAEELWLNAGLDGELDVEQSLQLQARLAADPAFKAAWQRRQALAEAIRAGASYHRAPPALVERLARALAANAQTDTQIDTQAKNGPAAPARRRWLRRLAGFSGVAIGGAVLASGLAGVSLGLLWERRREPGEALAADAVAGHTRALLADRLIEVASADQHQVRPWLSARLSFATAVPDLSAQGFELLGARRDLLDGQMVAALVYRRRQHLISAFVRPQRGEQAARLHRVRGFNVIEQAHAGMGCWLVSDLNAQELGDFAELLRGAS